MKAYTRHILLCIPLLSFAMIACTGKTKKTEAGAIAGTESHAPDTMKIIVTPELTDSVKIIFSVADTTPLAVTPGDIRKISGILSRAIYDMRWNDSGIMVKMVAPDNTMLVYSGTRPEEPDFIMIWKEGGRLKSHGKWFTLDTLNITQLYNIIDNYAPKK